MAEIDMTVPLEPVQASLTLFEQTSDRSSFSSPDRNVYEPEIDIVTRELTSCRVQLEGKEEKNEQATVKMAALRETTRELSEKYDVACLDAHGRFAELEAGSGVISGHQSATASECCALRDELAAVRRDLDAMKAANAYVLWEVESVETRRIMERESAREALRRILELNDAVLSSAVAAIRTEEERSVFFQEATLAMLNSDRNLEVVRRQQEMMAAMEEDLLAKTVEIDYLQSELKQLMELHASSQPVADSIGKNGEVSRTSGKHQDQGGLPRLDRQNIESEITVEVLEEPKSQAWLVAESSRKDINAGVLGNMSGNEEDADADAVFGTKAGTVICKDDGEFYTKEIAVAGELDDGEFYYTKEIIVGGKLDDGYALLAAKKGDALKDGSKLDAALAEISDLRFSLEEAVRRAVLAEEAKAALERKLMQAKISPQRPPASEPETRRDGKPRSAPPSRPISSSPSCLSLGKVLNMKFK